MTRGALQSVNASCSQGLLQKGIGPFLIQAVVRGRGQARHFDPIAPSYTRSRASARRLGPGCDARSMVRPVNSLRRGPDRHLPFHRRTILGAIGSERILRKEALYFWEAERN